MIEQGVLFLDPCNVIASEEVIVADRILEEMAHVAKAKDGLAYTLSERKRRGVEGTLRWPD